MFSCPGEPEPSFNKTYCQETKGTSAVPSMRGSIVSTHLRRKSPWTTKDLWRKQSNCKKTGFIGSYSNLRLGPLFGALGTFGGVQRSETLICTHLFTSIHQTHCPHICQDATRAAARIPSFRLLLASSVASGCVTKQGPPNGGENAPIIS